MKLERAYYQSTPTHWTSKPESHPKLRHCVFIKQGFKDSLKMTDLALVERLTCFEWEPGESIITVTGVYYKLLPALA